MTELFRRTYSLLPTSLVFALHRKNAVAELQMLTGQTQMTADQYDAVADSACATLNVLRHRGIVA